MSNTLQSFLSNGGLLKMLTIVGFFIVTCVLTYEVLIVHSADPTYTNLFYAILLAMANSLGFAFGHSNAVQAVQIGAESSANPSINTTTVTRNPAG